MSYTWENGTITDTYTCDRNEEYRTNPIYEGGEGNGQFTYTGVKQTLNPSLRYAMYINQDNKSLYSAYYQTPYSTRNFSVGINPVIAGITEFTSCPVWAVPVEISTNIPIFEDITDAQDYMFANSDEIALEILKKAVNYPTDENEPDGYEFEITNPWINGTWSSYGVTTHGAIAYRNVKGKIVTGGKIAMYPDGSASEGALKYKVVTSAEFDALHYSIDGLNWLNTDTFPFEYFYRERTNEIGTFDFGYNLSNNYVPIYKDQSDATDYIQGIKDISESENWSQISSQYPTQNTTGIDDTQTTMGEVFTRPFFSQQYICSVGALQEISNAFYDTDSGGITGIVDDIIKGLRMYGNDVSQAIQGLMFFPIDLNQVFTSVQSQNYIFFGGYQFQMQNSVNKIIYPNGYVDFGSFELKPSFNNYRDHSPYTRLYCFLAYIGWIELDIDRYLGKTVSIRYYIDTRTGGCLACIFANGILTDYATGQMGVQMPITVTSYTEYANAQLQTLLTFGNGQGQNASNIASMGGQLAQVGVSGGAIATASVGLGAVGLGIGATKTLYGLTQNNINNFNKTKGGSTGMLNMFLPQECMFLFEIQDADETPNERSLQGYPSNASGQLQSFSGYLEVDSVNLVCGGATDNEKAEIIAQLKNGVII